MSTSRISTLIGRLYTPSCCAFDHITMSLNIPRSSHKPSRSHPQESLIVVSPQVSRLSQPLILLSSSPPFEIHSTLLHRINTSPSTPLLLASTNSSVLRSWMFMYESTLTRSPWYSVCPHFRRMMTLLPTLAGRVRWCQVGGGGGGVRTGFG